jgi:hypothetical protein
VPEVERLTGRKVRAFMSDDHINRTSARSCASLDGPIGGEHALTARRAGT